MRIWCCLQARIVLKVINWTRLSLLLVLALPGRAPAAERWKLQFFYDKASSSLNIQDIRCLSPRRCVAVGSIEDRKGHAKGTVISTSDGGQNWSLADLSE